MMQVGRVRGGFLAATLVLAALLALGSLAAAQQALPDRTATEYVDPAQIAPDVRPPTPEEEAAMIQIDEFMRAELGAGNLVTARELALGLLSIEQNTWGPTHPWTAGTYGFLSNVLSAGGDFAAAVGAAEAMQQIMRDRLGPDHPWTLDASVQLSNGLMAAGQLAEAQALAEATAKAAQRLGSAAKFIEFSAMGVVVDALLQTNNLLAAGDAQERVIALAEELHGADDPVTRDHVERLWLINERAALDLNGIALNHFNAGRFAEAAVAFEQALQLTEWLFGTEHEHALTIRENLAVSTRNLGQLNTAEEHFRLVYEGRERTIGPDHPATLFSISEYAATLNMLGRSQEAETLMRRSHERHIRVFGKDAFETLTVQLNLGRVILANGRPAEAEELFLPVLLAQERVFGPNDLRTLETQNAYASALYTLGRSREAEQAYRKVVAGLEVQIGPDDWKMLEAIGNLATTLDTLGRSREAEPLHRRVAETYARTAGPEHPSTLTAVANLAISLGRLGQFDEAEKLQRSLLLSQERVYGRDHPATLHSLVNLGSTLQSLGRYDEAFVVQRQALDLYEQVSGSRHPDTLTARGSLAQTLLRLDRTNEAESLLLELIATSEGILGPEHPATLIHLSSLAATLNVLDRVEEAEALRHRVFEASKRTLGPVHPETLKSQLDLSEILLQRGQDSEALEMLQDAVTLSENTYGPDDPVTLNSVGRLGSALAKLGRLAEAETLLRRQLESYEHVLGPQHPATLTAASGFGSLLLQLGRTEDASALHQRALDAATRTLGPEHSETLAIMVSRAGSLSAEGRTHEAESLLRRVLEITEERFGPDHRYTLIVLSQLATLLRNLDRNDAVEPILRRTMEARERKLGLEHPDTLDSINNYALTISNLGRAELAEALFRKVLEAREATADADHPALVSGLNNLASTLLLLGRFEEAMVINERANDIVERSFDPDHPTTLETRSSYAFALGQMGRMEEAVALYRKVVESRERLLGPDHLDTNRTRNILGTFLLEIGPSEEAERMHDLALRSLEPMLGPDHPETLFNLSRLAYARLLLDRPFDALAPARRALEGEIGRLGRNAGSASAAERLRERSTTGTGMLLALVAFRAAQQTRGAPDSDAEALMAEAFTAIQAAGQGGAARAIAQAAARVAAGEKGLEDIVRGWAQARQAREALNGQYADAASAALERDRESQLAVRAALSARREELDREIAAAEARLEKEFPLFFDLVRPPPVTLAELQGSDDTRPLLQPDEALIVLTPTRRDRHHGLVWAISRDRAAWAEIPLSGAQVSEQIGQLHAQLDGGGHTRTATADRGAFTLEPETRDPFGSFDRSSALLLYRTLFGNPEIQAVIGDKPDWILVPQGAFLSLPFAVLVTEPPAGADDDPEALRKTAWLGLSRSLTVTPSVSTLRGQRQAVAQDRPVGTVAANVFFGIGDPNFRGPPAGEDQAGAALADASNFFTRAAGNVESVRGLARLPGTRAEVISMAASFGAGPESYLLGAEATETRLADMSDSGRISQARVVLMATHGLMAGSFDGLAEPALAMTPPAVGPLLIDRPEAEVSLDAAVAQGARLDDGLLTASEAARLDLDADWVILSACDTAAGENPDANGLTGLARAFFYAGARALLVSHWKVRDDVAARLTTDAVRRAAATPGLSRTRALQSAMRAIMDDRSQDDSGRALSHPSAWAPFQIIGVE
jgi:tetratricopeptide (TPR) repeat protein/CHAT domain-containing protein